jgi:hypothetical protein
MYPNVGGQNVFPSIATTAPIGSSPFLPASAAFTIDWRYISYNQPSGSPESIPTWRSRPEEWRVNSVVAFVFMLPALAAALSA